jgi:single-stranded-DNA-specific exonuclease
LPAAKVEEFRQRFQAHAGTLLTPADFERELAVDAEILAESIDDRTVAEVFQLAPFGFGNSSPTFVVRGMQLLAPPQIIKEKHAFMRFKSGSRTLRVKAWNFAEEAAKLETGATVDLAVCFEEDAYSAERGYAPWQAILKDLKPAIKAAASH